MVASIIDSTQGGEPEVRSWYDQGKTYAWMVQEYQRKYSLKVSPTMFSYRRSARGWERRRAPRIDALFPWAVLDRVLYPLVPTMVCCVFGSSPLRE